MKEDNRCAGKISAEHQHALKKLADELFMKKLRQRFVLEHLHIFKPE